MKNIKKVYWKGPWTIMSFPRQDCSIVYDGEKGTYDFYKGIARDPKTKNISVSKTKVIKSEDPEYTINGWMLLCLILTSALGVSFALNIINGI